MKSQCYNVVGVTFEKNQNKLNSTHKKYKLCANYHVTVD